jgi:DNA end-binding protein Ku
MARPLWTGTIGFGLVSVPVKLVSAVRNHTVRFHMLSKDGQCRLRQKLYCPDTGKEYDFSQTVKGYEVGPDQYVLLSGDELKRLKPDAGRTIEITDFVDLPQIDALYFDKPYYLVPDDKARGAKPYRLLLEAMRKTGKIAVAKFVMRDKEYLAAIRPLEGVLCLETMRFADEVVPADEVYDTERAREAEVNKKELDVAERLIDAMASKFEPKRYKDEYREKLEDLLDKKAKGVEIKEVKGREEEPPRVINLMKALEESLAKQKKAESTRARTPRRKSA